MWPRSLHVKEAAAVVTAHAARTTCRRRLSADVSYLIEMMAVLVGPRTFGSFACHQERQRSWPSHMYTGLPRYPCSEMSWWFCVDPPTHDPEPGPE